MTTSSTRESRFAVEFALLLALAFFLPLREVPKNLLWLVYVVTWMVGRARSRDFGGRPDAIDWAVIGLFASGALAAAFGGISRGDGNEWHATLDIVRYSLLFVLVRRAGYTAKQLCWLVAVLVVSCVLTMFEALWAWQVTGTRRALELRSVGHVNHSAIYMAICCGAAAGLLAARWRDLGAGARAALTGAVLVLAWGLFVGGSRAAAAAAIVVLLGAAFLGALAAGLGRRVWLAVGLVVALAALGGGATIDRQLRWSQDNYVLAQRDLIWNRGLAAWREAPVFGLGMENYGHFRDRDLEAWVVARGEVYDKSRYAGAPHGHSLYINTLVERGLVGLAALLVFLGAVGWRLVTALPRSGGDEAQSALWYAAASAWMVSVGIGVVNTTLHHEHAILAMLLMALPLTRAPNPSVPPAPPAPP
ncbi:MAG: O-antigen ligase family protein [Burkholderiales bacterium]